MFVDSANRVAFLGRAPEEPVMASLADSRESDIPVRVVMRGAVASLAVVERKFQTRPAHQRWVIEVVVVFVAKGTPLAWIEIRSLMIGTR